MRVLRDRMMALVSDATPPEIVGQAKVMHGLTQFYGGDTRGYISAMAEVTDGIPTSSPHYLRLSLVRVITYLQQGMGAVAEYPESPAAVGEIFRLRLRNLRVVNAALTGDLDSVRPDEIEPTSTPPNARTLLWPSEYAVACQTVRLMADASPNAAHHRFATKVKQAFGAQELPWMTSARLAAGQAGAGVAPGEDTPWRAVLEAPNGDRIRRVFTDTRRTRLRSCRCDTPTASGTRRAQ